MIRIQVGGHREGEEPIFSETYKGAVLATYERNGYDDSDFYAIVWDAEEKKIKHVEYATTRGWTYNNGASVDATEEVIEEAARFNERNLLSAMRLRALGEAKLPKIGRNVVVVRGRKIPKGTKGRVFWFGPDRFSRGNRVGLETVEGERFFTSADNVEAVGVDIDEEAIERHAHSMRTTWRWLSV
jgi:hypothetical protein